MKQADLPSNLLQSKRWSWHIPSEKTAEAVRSLVLSAPHLVKSTPVRSVYSCGDYYLKFERSPDLWSAFRKNIRPKARVEYENGRNLAAAGIPAVECLGWGKLGGTNLLVTRAMPGFIPLDKFFYERIVYGGGNADDIVSEIVVFLKRFYDAGFYHGDLHFGNILYNPASHALAWVDLIAIDHPGSIEPAARRFMSRCIVTLREGLTRAQMLHAIRAVGAAETDTEAETFYFTEVRHAAQHLIETWEKRSSQALGGYPKFADTLPCSGAPDRTMLLRKDWLGRPLLSKEDAVRGLPAGFERLRVEDESEAECIYLRSIYLQALRVRHRRVAVFARPDELWLEPLPAGLEPMPFASDNADAAFFWRTLDEQMIEAPADCALRMPDGSFYLTDLTRLYTGFEA
jgi:hypothetical protein